MKINIMIKIFLYIILSILLFIILRLSFSLLINRISFKKTEIFNGEVLYKMVVITECGMVRGVAEELIGNKCLITESGNFFVSKFDFQKAWPESPFDMKKIITLSMLHLVQNLYFLEDTAQQRSLKLVKLIKILK